jgi:hypothetical protein
MCSTESNANNPRRQQGVSVYRDEEGAFSTGDRVQLTVPLRELKAANREIGTVEGIKLFSRNHAGVVITDAGRVLVEEAKLRLSSD